MPKKQKIIITGIKQTPYVRKDGFQVASLSLKISEKNFAGWYRVSIGNEKPYVKKLFIELNGKIETTILLTDTNKKLKPGETTYLKVEIFDNKDCHGSPLAVYKSSSLKRTKHWQFYYSQTMHTDLGYTDYQEDLRPLFSTFLDTAKEYVKNSDQRKSDLQKYKYAIESSWVFSDGYMNQRNANEIREIVDLVKDGRMAIGAGKFNYMMECVSTEKNARAAYYTNRYLVDKFGISPDTTQRMFDNPAFSKSYVDIASSAGIKYGIHSMNPDRSPYHKKKLFDLFYMEGMNPENKLLIFNEKTYGDNYGFGGSHGTEKRGDAKQATKELLNIIEKLDKRDGRRSYPYDKFPLPLIPFGDNKQPTEEQIVIVNAVNNDWNKKGYCYPRIVSAFPEDFFKDIEEEYGNLIPVEKGTEESWWSDGWGTTAFESGIGKQAAELVPVAETLSSLASVFCKSAYPYDDLYTMLDRSLTYDEHTWGYHSYTGDEMYEKQYEWKRSNAFAAKSLADKTARKAIEKLSASVKTMGTSIYVFNSLSWVRNDVVTVDDFSTFPKYFEVFDDEKSIPYILENGKLSFIATGVPPIGYKTFLVKKAKKMPTFTSKVASRNFIIENQFYKVSFSDDGTIGSIIDKKNNNREMVDLTCTERFNQYNYYDDFAVPFRNMGVKFSRLNCKKYVPNEKETTISTICTALGETAKVETATFRAGSIRQKVTLYNDIQRIDIENEVVKAPLPRLTAKEEGFYVFPFKAGKDYEIRYDLPIGNVAEGEQIYGTSHDWYTVNKWVNVYDKSSDYSMTLTIPNSSLLQFGERRTGKWSFDYISKRPYIFSYVFNNMWQTNFQGDQPGYAKFNYSICGSKGKNLAKINEAGFNSSVPLQATVINGENDGTCGSMANFLKINSQGVILTTMKTAEANGDGMIVRFAEIAGENEKNVKVTLPENFVSSIETDIIENNIGTEMSGSTIDFDISAYGFKTFRVKTAQKLAKAENVVASSVENGTEIRWETVQDADYYEIFRGRNNEKAMYLATTKWELFFDTQVFGDLCNEYFYILRACSTGEKGAYSNAISPVVGSVNKDVSPEKTILSAIPREKTRIDLFWTPVHSDALLNRYEIIRNGQKIADIPNTYVTTYRDKNVVYGGKYKYILRAVDIYENASESQAIFIDHDDNIFLKSDSKIALKRRLF